MSELLKRTLFGVLFIGVVLASLQLGYSVSAVVFGLLTAVAASEFARMTQPGKKNALILFVIASLSLYLIGVCVVYMNHDPLFLAILSLPGILAAIGFLRVKVPRALGVLMLISALYLGLGFAYVPATLIVFGQSMGFTLILSFFILLWTSDTMAYVVGRSMGRHTLFERLSPKKTIEGFVGGWLFAVLAGQVIFSVTEIFESMDWVIVSSLVATLGTTGDLIESGIKRAANVKDSGRIIPGHGGILDRFDGLFLSLPPVFAYFSYQFP